MPKVPDGKKGLYVYLDVGVYDALYTLIKQKYSCFHGVVSAEVQDALVSWIRAHDSTLTQTYTKFNPVLPRSHLSARKIIQELYNAGFTYQVSMNDLKVAVGKVRGSDPRTIRKWVKFLVNNGYLKILRTNIFEIL